MARERDSEQFEWVNAWAQSTHANVVSAPEPVVSAALANASGPESTLAPPPVDDQLTRDIAEIERARDALSAMPMGTFSARCTQALTLVPSRTADSVPVFVGGVLALVMLMVFGAAAAMTKLSR